MRARRILALVLAAALTVCNVTPTYAAGLTQDGLQYTEEETLISDAEATEEETSDETEASDEKETASEEEASKEQETASEEEASEEQETASEEEASEEKETESETPDEQENASEDDALETQEDDAELVTIISEPEESESGKSYLDGTNLSGISESAKKSLRRARAAAAASTDASYGSCLSALADEYQGIEALYQAMVQNFLNGTVVLKYTADLDPAITFETTIQKTSDGGLAFTGDDAYISNAQNFKESFQIAAIAFMEDYPEAFWIAGMSISFSIGGKASTNFTTTTATATAYISSYTITVDPTYGSEYLDWDAFNTAVDEAVAQIKESAGEEPSRYDLLKVIHDYVCAKVTYDDTAAEYLNNNNFLYAHTAAGVFLGHNGEYSVVCDGYAKAFKVLCDRFEIPNVMVTGTGVTSSGNGPHRWNYVYMDDGFWYAVDTTWDDQYKIMDTYFLIGSSTTVFNNRLFSEDHLPEKTAASDSTTGEIIHAFSYPTLNDGKYDPNWNLSEEETTVHLYRIDDDGETLDRNFNSMDMALQILAKMTDKDSSYILRITDDMSLSAEVLSSVKSSLPALTLDLNGNTLSIDGDAAFTDGFDLCSTEEAGYLEVEGSAAFSSANSGILHETNTSVNADSIYIESGSWSMDELSAEIFRNSGKLVCSSFISPDEKASVTLENDSVLVVKKDSTFYHTTIGDESSRFYQSKDSRIFFYGSFSGKGTLEYGILGSDFSEEAVLENSIPVETLSHGTMLFGTNIDAFPSDHVQALKAGTTDTMDTYQVKDQIYAGDPIVLYAEGLGDEERQELNRFKYWKDVEAYLTTLSNTSLTYIVELTEDLELDTTQSLSIPSKVGHLVICGPDTDEKRLTALSCSGSVKLLCDLEFRNIQLKLDGNIDLNGKELTLQNVDAEIASISGKSGNVTMKDAYLKSRGDAVIAGTLTMTDAMLSAIGNMTLGNILSQNDQNRLLRGTALTITGTVSSTEEANEGDLELFGTVRKAAIDLGFCQEDVTYTEDTVLATAAKVSPYWFVVGSTYDTESGARNGYQSEVHKKKDQILYGASQSEAEAVWLQQEGADGTLQSLGGFAALQDALDEIDRLADSTGVYRITLKDDTEGTVTSTGVNLTFPTKAKLVQIGTLEEEQKTVYFKDALTLKGNVSLENIVLSPNTSGAIALGSYGLTMTNCSVADGRKIASVTGSGIAKGSSLSLVKSDLVIEGKVSDIGTLRLGESSLEIHGVLSIQNLYSEDVYGEEQEAIGSTLTGLATVKRNKQNTAITAISPQMTISGKVVTETQPITIGLKEKVASGYRSIDFQASEAKTLGASGIYLLKAANSDAESFKLSEENMGETKGGFLTKKSGYVTWLDKTCSVILSWTEGTQVMRIGFRTFADAVSEINSRKTKRAYQILIQADAEANTASSPAVLTMPNQKYISKLTIASEDTARTICYQGNLTMTSNVLLKNVTFRQMVKSGGKWVDADVLKQGYPSAVTLSTGYSLEIEGQVTFNTPLNLKGSSAGTLSIAENGVLFTETNGIEKGEDATSQIAGSITGFNKIHVLEGQTLKIREYGTKNTKGKMTYTAALLNVKNLELDKEGSVEVTGQNAGGKLTLTNVTFNDTAYLRADRDFTISGTLTVRKGSPLLSTRQKGTNKATYLNVKGKVVREDAASKISIGVYPYALTNDAPLEFNLKSASVQLLATKYGAVEAFRAWEKNTAGLTEYGPDAPDGYMLVKSGENISVQDASKVAVALCKGRAEKLSDADVINYYPGWTEAVTALNTLNSSSAEYTLLLIKDVSSSSALSMPTKAKTVYVSGGRKLVCGKAITLNTNMVFTQTDMNLKELKGNGKSVTLDSMTLAVSGNLTGIASLTLTGGAQLQASGAVTVTNLCNEGTQINTITYGRTSKNVSNLTVNGTISGSNEHALVLNMRTSGTKSASDYLLKKQGVKVTVDNTKKLAAMPKAGTTGYICQINGEDVDAALVKANQGIYLIDPSLENDRVELTVGEDTTAVQCLDLVQAVNEINTRSNANAAYTVTLKNNCTDTNLTDKTLYSALTLPGNNKAKSVCLKGADDSEETVSLSFTGSISSYGNLTMENLVLNSVNGGKSGSDASPKDFNISVYASKAGASLNLINVSAASLSLIQGVKTQANVSIQKEERAAQYLKTGFTKVGSLSLTNTDLTTAKGSSVTNLNLTNSGWNALGATTITNILKTDENSYLATKQTKDKKGNLYPQLTVSGSVNGTVVCKVMPVTASANEITYLTAYKDVKLLKALKASAEHFTAETEEITDEDRIIYKDTSGYVMIGDRNEMTAKITDASGMSTYAKSYKDAVTIIDNQNDSKSAYEIELLRFGVIRTGAGGTSYGELALPSKAAQVTIKGYTGDEDARSEIHYTGTLKPKCAVAFENVVLTEGTLSKKGVYTPTYQITPVLGKVSVTFKEGTTTLKRANVTAGSDEAEADLVFASASASKGVLSIQGRKIYCKGKFVVPELRLSGENELIGAQAITLTNLSDTGSGAELLVDTRFTATAKSSQKSVTQLTVKGSIGSGVTLGIAPRMYDRSTKSYHKMTLAEADSKNVRSASPSAVQKLAVMGKASAEKISVYYADGENTWKKLSSLKVSGADRAVRLFKYDSGLYLTTQDAAVRVSGSQSDGQQIYEAEFLTWAQAVSEIDRIANTGISYEIELLKNIGDVSASQSPLGTLSLPTKVKKIRIYSEGDPFCLFFTGTTVTLRSNTTFENVGLIAVKKYSSKSRVWYSAVSFTINAGNYPLTQKQMAVGSGSYLSSPSKITGSTKSTYEFASGEDHTKYRTAPADQISGFGTITIDDDAQIPKSLSGTTKLVLKEGAELVSTSGSIAFKDLILGAGAKIEAKSITGSGTAYLNGGCLSVSSSTGKCTLTNVVLGAEGNRLESRQDKNGGSPLEITGTVKKADGLTGTYTLAIGLYYNNGTQYAQLHNGMTLLTAAKAEASWFIPLYTVVREEGTSAGMGQQHEGYGTWKSGKLIKYGECL